MRAGAASPMGRWRSWPLPAACWGWPPDVRPLLAGLIHRRQLTAAEILHARRQSPAACDPAAHVLRIDAHQELRGLRARDGPAIAAGMPRGMEAETGPRCNA